MPIDREEARGSARKKRKREISVETESLPIDEPEANSCVPVAKKVMRFNMCNKNVHLLEITTFYA